MKSSLTAFYRGKKTLVTGHTGFIGGWLTAWLKILGAQVIGFSMPPETQPNLFCAARIGQDMVSLTGDIRELAQIASVFEEYHPEIVFHSAAQPLVMRSYGDPVATYATNVMGTVHVLEAARHCPSVRAIVIITSDKCYENREWVWGYREDDPMGGRDPYSSSKACAELVTAAYRRSFLCGDGKAEVASVRVGNAIGGGDWAEHRLVPDIIRSVASGSPVVIRSPNAVRPWQHVLEPLRGYLMLGQRLWDEGHGFAQAWNFGPREEDAISVIELAGRLIDLWGPGRVTIQQGGSALPEAQLLKLDCSKARTQLGWRPLLTIQDALKLTVEWYRAYLDDPGSARDTTTAQIQKYMESAQG